LTQKLDEIIETFSGVDRELRAQVLLDYARKLPAIPDRLKEQRDAGVGQVHECMTPVFVWVEPGRGDEAEKQAEDGLPRRSSDGAEAGDAFRLYVDVAEEAPTIQGIGGILVAALDGEPLSRYEAVPDDLLEQLKLHEILRMNRTVGVRALVARIKRLAAAQAA